jgi:hypothetical protein
LRSVVKSLTPYPAALGELRAKMTVKSSKDKLYEKYVKELKDMIGGLNVFLESCNVATCESDTYPSDHPDDTELQKHTANLEALKTNAEHHLGGAKAAKTRFTNLS